MLMLSVTVSREGDGSLGMISRVKCGNNLAKHARALLQCEEGEGERKRRRIMQNLA
jgi:hypothetical protein